MQAGYTLHYWMPATLLIILIGGLAILKRKVSKKTIAKNGKKEDGTVKIFIEVENRTKQSMENVEVRDFVPEMLEIDGSFDTLEPEIEEAEYGTKLIWDIGSMKPKESRILVYKIRSDMDVESEIILKEAELIEGSTKVSESEKIKASFPAKQST